MSVPARTGLPAQASLEVSRLRKTYGKTVAADDVSFSVQEGEIFGLLGPNGTERSGADP
jgi:ABC-2 type transport system ATP-binding protein